LLLRGNRVKSEPKDKPKIEMSDSLKVKKENVKKEDVKKEDVKKDIEEAKNTIDEKQE
jgi:hypothetical protein